MCPSAGAFVVVAPVVAVGIDGVAGEVFAVGWVDGVFVDEHQDRRVGVLDPDAEVVQSADAAQGEFAEAVDGVDADSIVGVWVVAAGSGGFQGGVVGGCSGLAVGSVHRSWL
jgi:hypothetical protein